MNTRLALRYVACLLLSRSNSSRNRCAASRVMLSEKLGPESTERAMSCQNFITSTKTMVLASATVAAPVKLSISISKYPLLPVTFRVLGEHSRHCDTGHIGQVGNTSHHPFFSRDSGCLGYQWRRLKAEAPEDFQ